jgi:hypothetical protein
MIAMPDASAFQILRWRTGETHKVGRVFRDMLRREQQRTKASGRRVRQLLGREAQALGRFRRSAARLRATGANARRRRDNWSASPAAAGARCADRAVARHPARLAVSGASRSAPAAGV